MPTLDELREAATIRAKRLLEERQREQAKEIKALDERVKNEPTTEDPPDDKSITLLQRVTGPNFQENMKKIPSKEEQKLKARSLMRAADDLVRTAAGPVGNAFAAGMSKLTGISGVEGAFSPDLNAEISTRGPSTLPQEHLLSEEARRRSVDRFGEGLTTGVDVGGTVAQAIALPNTLFASPAKAAFSAGALSATDTVLDRMSNNKPVTNPEGIEQIVGSAASGTALGFGGYHIGNLFSKLVGKLANEDRAIGKIAAKHIQSERNIVNQAGKAMDDSNVVIKRGYFAHFVNQLQKDLEALPFTKDIAKNGWKGFNSLRSQTGKGRLQDMTLRQFNEYRKAIRDSVRSASTGMLKPTVSNNDIKVVNTITKRMNDFVESLASRPNALVSGDGKAGVAAWNKMNEYHKRVARADRIADFIMNAESHALSGTKDIVVALKDEFSSLFTSKAGREILNSEFPEKEMQEVLSLLAHGNFSERILSRADRMMGSTLFSPVFRALKAGHSAGFAADQMRKAALDAVDLTLQGPMTRPVGGQIGAALGLGAGSQIPQSTPLNSMPPFQGQLPDMPPGMPPLQSQKMIPTPAKPMPQPGAGPGTTSPNVSPDPLQAINPRPRDY